MGITGYKIMGALAISALAILSAVQIAIGATESPTQLEGVIMLTGAVISFVILVSSEK